MDMAALLPWLANLSVLWARNGNSRALLLESTLAQNPLLLFAGLWATMVLYMLMADLLNRWEVSGGLYAALIIGVLTLTSLLGVRFLLYPDMALGDFRWLRETIFAVIDLVAGVRGEILLIVLNYFLWLRVARYTNRSLTFFAVGVSFRVGMLLVIVGSALLARWGNRTDAATLYLLLFFAFGLCAVALARIDQKAIGTANSSGALLPWDRFAQLWVVIAGVLGAAFAAATTFYNPPMLRTVLGWFAPVGQLVQWLLTGVAYALFIILTPFFEWLAARLQAMMVDMQPLEMAEQPPSPDPMPLNEVIAEVAFLRYCIGAAMIFGALILLLVYFVRMARRERKGEAEETTTEGGLQPGGINLGLDRLKNWLALLGRYGVGSQLLAAISVENIYANLGRLARRKGFPRQPAQGPDRYLPVLIQAFEGHEAELSAITAAYVRVRYAERPITAEELDAVRTAYATITAPPPHRPQPP
jgi:hypothetical protein